MKTNYDALQKAQINKIVANGEKPKLLMHACCAPCSTACLERVADFFDITVYYYNPNITSEEEYVKRLNELKNYLDCKYGDKIDLLSDACCLYK